MVVYRFLGYYAIPLGFIATFYIVMARHLVRSTKNMPGEAQGQAKQIQARKKVSPSLFFIVLYKYPESHPVPTVEESDEDLSHPLKALV